VTGGSKGGRVYTLCLVLDGTEQPVPVLGMAASGRGSKDLAAVEIRSALRNARGPTRPVF
jgi:hypothetical protein